MERFIEEFAVYTIALLFCGLVIWFYLRKQKKESKIAEEKIARAKSDGTFEPVSLHPVVDEGSCIKTGACIAACPEKDILGIVNGRATPINASRCVGHGACFHACPTQAITLCIGTEKRGVDLPHVNHNFETNVPGIFIAGELGGMGLIKNSVEQGKQAVENIGKSIGSKSHQADFDLTIIGAGPAGISASLMAKKLGMKFVTLEQDTLGGTVYTFPRAKIVMTSAMDLPLHGKVKLFETKKSALLELWQEVLKKNDITIRENEKVESIARNNDIFQITTIKNQAFSSRTVLLAIGRRGSPRKLGIPGENSEKVAYRLLEPEHITGQDILVVGGGDSAIESALLLHEQNKVTLSYRGETFSRLKPKNQERILSATGEGKIKLMMQTNPVEILENNVLLKMLADDSKVKIANDLVYIFAGGELPIDFLQKAGIGITKKFGEAILSHK
jgi:thioredoxin reductase/Pyruvate/2-oxoacid:ferredoxin oxidoreductase delta subunit